MGTTIVSFQIDKGTLEVLDRLARESEKTRSACIRELIVSHIQNGQHYVDGSVAKTSITSGQP